jgi:hypothetical protein
MEDWEEAGMTWNRRHMTAGAAVLVLLVIVLAGGLWLLLRDGDSGESAATTPSTSAETLERPEIAKADAARYAALFQSMEPKRTRIGMLAKWPKPYQAYHDQFGDRCYEWKSGRTLYNLCFKDGVLALKDPG